jgi:hypothetical protein
VAQDQKTLDSWKSKTEETWDTVESVLIGNGFALLRKSKGSHSQWGHEALAYGIRVFGSRFADYGPDGRITIIRSGDIVYGEYLERILYALEEIDEINEFRDKHEGGNISC